MGQKAAREKHVAEEFKAILDAKKVRNQQRRDYLVRKNGVEIEYLTLSDMLKFKQPRNRDIMLDPNHLGLIFVLDDSKDGRFYLKDIHKFADLYFERQASNPNVVDVPKEFQGYCTLVLWNFVTTAGGVEKFVHWFGRVFSIGNVVFEHHGENHRTIYVERGALKVLDDIFAVSRNFGIDTNHTFGLLQQVSRQKKLMPAESRHESKKAKYKDVIPREALEYFGREFIDGFIKYMTELGFEADIDLH